MANKPKIHAYQSLSRVVTKIKDDLNSSDYVLLFAYNGTGKTRLSMEFKNKSGGKASNKNTLYFNAYTEDLFHWDNDLEKGLQPKLRLNQDAQFFSGFKELALEEKIFKHLSRYATFDFKIDYQDWAISFYDPQDTEQNSIKISRGEEMIFIWCIFLTLCELAIAGDESYAWVKYIYIDDPVSSLDDNNAIALAADLAKILLKGKENKIKSIISSHHTLFFNVICNELKKHKPQKYFLYKDNTENKWCLRYTTDTPFFHHIAMLSELHRAIETNAIYTHHFNVLRGILEKTATFFGHDDFSACIHGIDDEDLYARALNLLSHGSYSVYQPQEMVQDNKELFKNIFSAFIERYQFALPEIFNQQKQE